MSRSMSDIAILVIRILLTLAFGAAGFAKLSGADMMVGTFDQIGWGQWFRYLTGVIEIGGAVLLWIPRRQLIGAGLLLCTMVCAVLFHLLVLGPSAVPALVLGVLAAVIVWTHRPATT